jgi:hypothetical protein
MMTPTLYAIDECPDLMVDACLLDENFFLVFASFWGRDTAMQQFLARLTLGAKEEGLTQFHLVSGHHSVPVDVPSAEHLAKQNARSFRKTLFGSMTNLWLYHRLAVTPDRANGEAYAILPAHAENVDERLWPLVQTCCPLPLLSHWQEIVLDTLKAEGMLKKLPRAFGSVMGFKLDINMALLERRMKQLIRTGALGLTPQGDHRPLALAA